MNAINDYSKYGYGTAKRMEVEPELGIDELRGEAAAGLEIGEYHAEDQALLQKVDSTAGNGDGRVSAQEIDLYQQRNMAAINILGQNPNPTQDDLVQAQSRFQEFQQLLPVSTYAQQVQGYASSLAEIAERVDAAGNGNGSVTQTEISTFIDQMSAQASASPGTLEGQQAGQLAYGASLLSDVLKMKQE